MAARYSYSNPYQADELAMYQYQQQVMAMQSGPRRFFSAVGRFFYRLIVLTLVIAAVGGVLFVLQRTGVLLQIARGAGIETQYVGFEKVLAARGLAAPRTIEPPSDVAGMAAPGAAPVDANPSEKSAETVRAAVTTEAKATADGVAIVSFDSLPTTAAKAEPEGEAPKADAAKAEPARPSRASSRPMTIAEAAAAGPARQSPKPKTEKPKPAKPTELTRSIPLPKAPPKPEPVAKAEPKPEPAPPPPKPVPEEDHTKPRSGDNPLKAAIRASMAGKKPE